MVGEHAGHHRFADGNGADADARIVAPFGRDLGVLALDIDRLARGQDRRCRLDREAGDDRLTGGDAAEDSARVVAEEVGQELEIISLYSDSLSEVDTAAGTYLDYMRTNAETIAAALGDF